MDRQTIGLFSLALGTQVLINPAHVVKIAASSENETIIHLAGGDLILVSESLVEAAEKLGFSTYEDPPADLREEQTLAGA